MNSLSKLYLERAENELLLVETLFQIPLNRNPYKLKPSFNISNLRVVNMLPGDHKVAGCFYFSKFSGGFL